MAKNKIEFDEEFEDFQLIGIATGAKDYRLLYLLNTALNADFERIQNHIYYNKKTKTEIKFPLYEWSNEYKSLQLLLFGNKNIIEENQFNYTGIDLLCPELELFQFILKIEGTFNPQILLDKMKENKELDYIKVLEISKVKSIQNLIKLT